MRYRASLLPSEITILRSELNATKAAVGKFNKDIVYDVLLEQPKDIPELPPHSWFTEAVVSIPNFSASW